MANRGNVPRDYIIIGVVVDRATQRGVLGLRVDTWDRDTRYHDLLGQAITDEDGAFTVAFDSDYFGDYAPDTAPDTFFRVFRDGVQILTTFDKPMHNMQAGTTRVRLEVDLPQAPVGGKDRVTAEQTIKAVDWWRASDFRGVVRQARDKTLTVSKLFGSLASDSIKNFDFKPVRPTGAQERDIVGQDQDSARRALAAQSVQVTDVQPVSSLSPGAEIKSVAQYPLRLVAGDHVTLYEQNGVVSYYTRDPAPATSADSATIQRIDSDVQTMKAQVQSVDDLRAQIATVKAASDDAAARASQEDAATKATADELESVRQELEQVRQASANKDVEIQKLQSDLALVRTAQDNLASSVSADRIHALELAVRQISGGKIVASPVGVAFAPRLATLAAPAKAKPPTKKPAKKAAKKAAKKPATTSKKKATPRRR